MHNSQMIDAACAGIRAICVPYSIIPAETVDDLCAIIRGTKIAVEANKPATVEPPMSCDEAARLLKISKSALHYHCRAGRIRRVKVPGSSRSRGLLAADVRAILAGGSVK